MDNQEVLEYLLKVSESEARALEFMKRNGRKPTEDDFMEIFKDDIIHLIENINWMDYIKSRIWHEQPPKIVYHEQECFLPGANIELNKTDRYVEQIAHTHDFYEVECVVKGKGIHIVEKQEIPLVEGDIVIVPPGVEHKAYPEADAVVVNLKMRKRIFDNAFVNLLSTGTELSTYLSRTLYSSAYRTSLTFHCKEDAFVKSVVLSMYGQQIEQKPFYNYMLEGMTMTLFSYLMQEHSQDVEFSNFIITSNDRMTKIISYINENYKAVTLKSAAQKFYLSEPHLSSIIKKETGSTFSSLLREIKMQKATMLLLTTDLRIDDVCEQSGYQDTTQFIKTFKKYHGLSPKKYRQSMQLNRSTSIASSELY